MARIVAATALAEGLLHGQGPTSRAGFLGSSNARHGLHHFPREATIGFRDENGLVHQAEHGEIIPAVPEGNGNDARLPRAPEKTDQHT